MTYQNILVRTEGAVGIVTLNRPQALNALNSPMMDELSAVLDGFEADDSIRCVVITGSEKAFAAGAGITEMGGENLAAGYTPELITRNWERGGPTRKPGSAARAGPGLGGGC